MYQRSSTYIMSTKEGAPILYKRKSLSPLRLHSYPDFPPKTTANYWEGGPPTQTADRIEYTLPILLAKLFAQRQTVQLAEADKEILDGLRSVGYKLNDGEEGSGFLFLALKRAGGYYLDVGACQKIVDGKIKLKSGSEIERYTEKGLRFKDGSEVEADVILYATGYVFVPSFGPPPPLCFVCAVTCSCASLH